MITYEYECTACDTNFEVQQSIKDDAYTVCPECHKQALRRVINTPMHVHVVGEPTTIGQLAERNSKKMSKEEMDMANRAFQTQKSINRIPENRRPKTTAGKPVGEVPEWVEKPRTKTTKEVGKLSPEQTKKYVMTGE